MLRGKDKYILITQNKMNGHMLYFEESDITSGGGRWTPNLEQAYGFKTLEEAKTHAAKYKYGKLSIAIVTSKGHFKWENE